MGDDTACVLIKRADGASVALHPCACVLGEADVLIVAASLDVEPERLDELQLDGRTYVLDDVRHEAVHYRCRYR